MIETTLQNAIGKKVVTECYIVSTFPPFRHSQASASELVLLGLVK